MKRALGVIATLAIAVTITACSPIDRGNVVGKAIEPGYWIYSGKTMIWDDQDWRLDIRDDETDGWVYVTEETYNAYEVGDYFEAAPE